MTGLKKALAADCVVQYYAPWCGFCKQLAPVYEQVRDRAPSHVHIVRFNMDKHGEEMQKQGVGVENFGVPVTQDVQGFPTIIMYKKDGTRSVYKGPRKADSILQTIRAHYAPSLAGGGTKRKQPAPAPASSDVFSTESDHEMVFATVKTREKTYTIGSYNMSFATDLGQVIGSEKHFIKNAMALLEKDNPNPHDVWESAAALVCRFFKEKQPMMMGFQEMNDVEQIIGNQHAEGFQGLIKRLKDEMKPKSFAEANTSSRDDEPDYWYTTYSTNMKFGKPTNLIIWHRETCGDLVSQQGYDLQWDRAGLERSELKNDNNSWEDVIKDKDGQTVKKFGPHQAGRPLQMVRTTENYCLINLHAPNDALDSKNNMTRLKESLRTQIESFCKEGDNIIMVGDFNDPFYGFNKDPPLRIHENEFTVSKEVKSCCYNYNSACTDDDFNDNHDDKDKAAGVLATTTHKVDNHVYKKALSQECYAMENEEISDPHARPITEKKLPDGDKEYDPSRGSIDTYRFTGDYCIVPTKVGNVVKFDTYRPADTGYRPADTGKRLRTDDRS